MAICSYWDSFLIAESEICNDSVYLVWGGNICYGHGFSPNPRPASQNLSGAIFFGYQVKDSERFGVAEFEKGIRAISIKEKPHPIRPDYAVTCLCFYNNDAIDIAQNVTPSTLGELEITSINLAYLALRDRYTDLLGRSLACLDTGIHERQLSSLRLLGNAKPIK